MGGNEAFSRVKIDRQLEDAGWRLTDGRSVRFEYVLPDGTKVDYVLCDRRGQAVAVLEAKRASVSLVVRRRQLVPQPWLAVISHWHRQPPVM
jgi:type I restriction enzyme, R subunit